MGEPITSCLNFRNGTCKDCQGYCNPNGPIVHDCMGVLSGFCSVCQGCCPDYKPSGPPPPQPPYPQPPWVLLEKQNPTSIVVYRDPDGWLRTYNGSWSALRLHRIYGYKLTQSRGTGVRMSPYRFAQKLSEDGFGLLRVRNYGGEIVEQYDPPKFKVTRVYSPDDK